MALEYLPKFLSNARRTFTASAAITQGQLVALTAAWSVAPAGTPTAAWIGVAMSSAAAGQKLTVLRGGTQVLAASGTINAGDVLVAATTVGTSTPGAVETIPTTSPPALTTVVGIALSSAVDGQLVDVQMKA